MSDDESHAERPGNTSGIPCVDPSPVLVMGIGNILLRDEGVGVRVIEAMQQKGVPHGVELVDAGTAGADLVDFFAQRRKVIVVDAMDAGEAPGTIFRLRADDLMPEPGAAISLHQLGLVESLVIARQLGCEPQDLIVFGVQPEEIEPGLELSASLAEVVPKIIDAIEKEIEHSLPNVGASPNKNGDSTWMPNSAAVCCTMPGK